MKSYVKGIPNMVCNRSVEEVSVATLLFGSGDQTTLREILEAVKDLKNQPNKEGRMDRVLSRLEKGSGVAENTASIVEKIIEFWPS